MSRGRPALARHYGAIMAKKKKCEDVLSVLHALQGTERERLAEVCQEELHGLGWHIETESKHRGTEAMLNWMLDQINFLEYKLWSRKKPSKKNIARNLEICNQRKDLSLGQLSDRHGISREAVLKITQQESKWRWLQSVIDDGLYDFISEGRKVRWLTR
jgi:hypothetical protein